MIPRIKLQLTFALFWFASAYLATGALTNWTWTWRCAWLNLIIGLVGLLLITRTELGERIFYQGPRGDEDGLWLVGVLWALPIVGFFLALLWWVARLLGIFNW